MTFFVLQVASPRAPHWVDVMVCSVVGGFVGLGRCWDRMFVEVDGSWSEQRHCIFRLMDIVGATKMRSAILLLIRLLPLLLLTSLGMWLEPFEVAL